MFKINFRVYKVSLIPSSYIVYEMHSQSERKVVTNGNFDGMLFKNASSQQNLKVFTDSNEGAKKHVTSIATKMKMKVELAVLRRIIPDP